MKTSFSLKNIKSALINKLIIYCALTAGRYFQEANLILSKAGIRPLTMSGCTISLRAVLLVSYFVDKIKMNNKSKSKLIRFMTYCTFY
jgi:hypothetical protein